MRRNMKEDHHELLEIYMFTPSPFEEASPAWPVRIGHNLAKPNYHIGPRTTQYYYLMFVLAGQGTFMQNGKTYALRTSDIFCLFPGLTHEYVTDPKFNLQKLFIAFDGPMASELLRRGGLTMDCPHRAGVLNEDLIGRMWRLLNYIADHPAGSTDLGRLGSFFKVFSGLEHNLVYTKDEQPVSSSWLDQGMHYMNLHYTEGISVSQVADYTGVSRTYFTKRFHETYGVSPIRYLQQLKIDKAKELIAKNAHSLAEIAQTVGYPDLFSFSKAFKKITGKSPKEYRLSVQ